MILLDTVPYNDSRKSVYAILDMDLSRSLNVYCPEWPPGGTIGHPGGQQKKFLPFGHGRDLVAFNGTGL